MTAAAATDIALKYLTCHLADGVGPVLLARIIKRFGTLDEALGVSMAALQTVEGIGDRRARAFFEARGGDAAKRELEKAERLGIRVICWEDDDYPKPLRHCDDPPVCLYIRGTVQPEDAVAVAIVGSRKCSRYGLEQSERFASLLAGAGFTIISGLARGIDGHAHIGALAARGRTIAVLGSGVDTIYPPEHADLAERVTASGAVIAEDPLGSAPSTDSFPRRNRIIAGMSLGVIVVEASKRSGALITARLASEYNREVFAVPGRVDTPSAVGVNDLIRKGAAKLVATIEDVLDELGDVGRTMARAEDDAVLFDSSKTPTESPSAGHQSHDPTAARASLSKHERSILDCLADDELHLDDITAATGQAPGAVAANLTRLQIKGLVIALPGSRYARRA